MVESPLGGHVEFFFIWLIIAIICGVVASSKGRSGIGWFLLGFLFSFFALILVALLPSLKGKPGEEVVSPGTHGKCPDCAEVVRLEAKVCKHCGKRFEPAKA